MNSSRAMNAVAAVLCFGILTLWVPERWAVSAYQAGVFSIGLWWALQMAFRPVPLRWNLAWLALAVPPLLGLVQIATGNTVYRWDTWNSVLFWLANWVLFGVVLQCSANEESVSRFRAAVLCFGAAMAIIAPLQMLTSGGKVFWMFPSGYTDFVLGPFVNRGQYAAFLEMVLPLALYSAIVKPRHSPRYWLLSGLLAASIAASASRAGMVLAGLEVAVAVALGFLRTSNRRGMARGVLGLAAVALLFTLIAGWEAPLQRFRDADPFAVRRETLQSSIRMVADKPLTGSGLGTWATVYPAYALYDDGRFVNQAHNDWIQWTAEGGAPLLAAMLLFAALLVKPAWKSIWGLGLLAVLLHCLVDYPMQQRPALAGLFFALAGALTSSHKIGAKTS
jgi:O-antigen ligase